jgi:hypothetical protein
MLRDDMLGTRVHEKNEGPTSLLFFVTNLIENISIMRLHRFHHRYRIPRSFFYLEALLYPSFPALSCIDSSRRRIRIHAVWRRDTLHGLRMLIAWLSMPIGKCKICILEIGTSRKTIAQAGDDGYI